MKFFHQLSRKLEINTDNMNAQELELTLECAYNVQKHLNFQIFQKSKPKFIGNLEVLNEMIAVYESAFIHTLTV